MQYLAAILTFIGIFILVYAALGGMDAEHSETHSKILRWVLLSGHVQALVMALALAWLAGSFGVPLWLSTVVACVTWFITFVGYRRYVDGYNRRHGLTEDGGLQR